MNDVTLLEAINLLGKSSRSACGDKEITTTADSIPSLVIWTRMHARSPEYLEKGLYEWLCEKAEELDNS